MQLPRPLPPPHSRRNPTGVAVRTTCCRFRCGWWPKASLDREWREAGGKTGAASQAADGARRGTKRVASGSLRERVGVGKGPARREGRKGRRARACARPASGASGRPRTAPRPGRSLGPSAPGHRGSRRGRGLAALAANGLCNGPHRGGPAPVTFRGWEGREVGAKRQRRVEKGTGNGRGGGGDLKGKPLAKVQPIQR